MISIEHDEQDRKSRQLLAAAEAQVARDLPTATDARPAEELLHELQVHQIELEMQNEALRQAQIDLEASRDRYADLYEFAPLGYLTLDANGMIAEINLTGATLLGTDRNQLLQRRFTAFVGPEDQDRWMLHFLDAKKHDGRSTVELVLKRGDGRFFDARLDCMAARDDTKVGAGELCIPGNPLRGQVTAIRVALTDISEHALAKQNEQNFRAVFERSPIGIGIAGADRCYRMVNPAFCRMLGYSEAELIGMSFTDVTHPDDVKLNLWNFEGLTTGEASHFALEKRYVRKDGEIVWALLNVVAVKSGSGRETYTIGLAEDITERRQAEEQRLADARQQRDTLVREVHHRIKNNLQSVAGLLQRELGRFLELDPRLEAAISQVNAIAVVHGLQSVAPDEAIGLCNGVKSICESVASLSRHPVQFHMEGGHPDACPVHVATGEAVSIALVINELILNAVKHSPHDGSTPTVSLSASGGSAQLLIRNALTAAHDFDIDTGAGLGTGLRLVRSLLPKQGAYLNYERDARDFMLTRLKLTAPVVTNQDHRR